MSSAHQQHGFHTVLSASISCSSWPSQWPICGASVLVSRPRRLIASSWLPADPCARHGLNQSGLTATTAAFGLSGDVATNPNTPRMAGHHLLWHITLPHRHNGILAIDKPHSKQHNRHLRPSTAAVRRSPDHWYRHTASSTTVASHHSCQRYTKTRVRFKVSYTSTARVKPALFVQLVPS